MTGRLFVKADQLRRANPGLYLGKFMAREKPDWSPATGSRPGDGVYRLAFRRWEQHWTSKGKGVVLLKGRVAGRLVTGLGAESVHEVGIRLNHAYGTPLIPGSAVKGVLRARIADERLRTILFGGPDSAALVTFQDAWWVPEDVSPLVMDVMTVHHPDYYSGNGAPTDLDNPNPVEFVSVRGSFLFVGEFGAEDPEGRWKRYVEMLLRDTLEKHGIGAKRSAGYGRFEFGI